jgi:hypothetical protein
LMGHLRMTGPVIFPKLADGNVTKVFQYDIRGRSLGPT